MKTITDIHIIGQGNGILVTVGCMYLVYQQENLDQFFKDLKDYLRDPKATEEEIRKRWGIESSDQPVTPGQMRPVAEDEKALAAKAEAWGRTARR